MKNLAHAVEAMVELGQISSKNKVVKEYLSKQESQIEEGGDGEELEQDLEDYIANDDDFDYKSLSKEDIKFIIDFKAEISKKAKCENDNFVDFMDSIIQHEEQKVFGDKKSGLPQNPVEGKLKSPIGEY